MKDRGTVFILGAGASCPYGYPSGARLRELICRESGFMRHFNEYLKNNPSLRGTEQDINRFTDAFGKSHIKSIDLFMSKNPKLAPAGKYIIAFEVLRLEKESRFAEEAKWRQEERERWRSSEKVNVRKYCEGTPDFIGGDWYSYIYNRLIEQQAGRDVLPDFSDGQLAFITFNYDRSLEQFFYESLRNSFTEAAEDRIVASLRGLEILHAYGQVAPLKWQDAKAGVDYRPPQLDEQLLQNAAANIRTIYEQKNSAELDKARRLLGQAGQIFFLGFGYARENMDVLGLPAAISSHCQVYGTAYGLIDKERDRICASVHDPRNVRQAMTNIEPNNAVDCLTLLRKHL